METFDMIRTLIVARLTREVMEQQTKINEYNAKALAKRQSIVFQIVQYIRNKPEEFVQHPVAGGKIRPEFLNIHNPQANGVDDKTMYVNIQYNQNAMVVGEPNVAVDVEGALPIPPKFQKEFRKYPILQWKNIDINTLATEKAAEIVLAGGDTMSKIDGVLKGVVPEIKIPKLD